MASKKERLAEIDRELAALDKQERVAAIDAELAAMDAKEAVSEDVGALEAGARSLAEGATFGFSEEIGGFFGGEEFEKEQEQRRLAGEEKFGALTTGAEIVGTVLTGIGAAVAAPITGIGSALLAGTIGGATLAAGKSEADFGSERFNEDVALGAAVGFVAAPVGIAGGKILSGIAGKVGRKEVAAGAGSLFRKNSDDWLRAAAAGDLGPEAKKISTEFAASLVDKEFKNSAKIGVGTFSDKIPTQLADDVLEQTSKRLGTKASALKTKVRKPEAPSKVISDDAFELDRIKNIDAVDINPAVINAESEATKKALRSVATEGTKQERSAAMRALNKIDQDEFDFIDMISKDPKAALRGEFGGRAKTIVASENQAVRKDIVAQRLAADAGYLADGSKASQKVQEAVSDPVRKEFQKLVDSFTFKQAGVTLLQGHPIKAGVRATGATLRAGLEVGERGAVRQGLESVATPTLAASAFNPQGGQ